MEIKTLGDVNPNTVMTGRQAGITIVKDENGETISMGKGQTLFGFTFNDGTFVETGFGKEGAIAAQAIANDSNNGTLSKDQTLANSSVLQTLEAKTNRTKEQIIADFADLKFLAQNTGVSSNLLNTERRALGLDLKSLNLYFTEKDLLTTYGYNPEEQANFYGSNTAVDPGAKILSDRWKDAPTEAQISEHNAAIESGEKTGTIITGTPVNDHAANIAFVKQGLLKDNVDLGSTKATTSLTGVGGGNLSPYGMGGVSNIDEIRALQDFNKEKYGADNPNFKTSDQQLDIFEWDNLFDSPKKEDEIEPPVDTGTVITGGYNPPTPTTPVSTQPTTAFTPDPITFKIPAQATQPYYNPSRATTSGTFTQPAETFASNVTAQNIPYAARAPKQAQYYQPQTIQEMTNADQSTDAFKLNQKLYRNPNTGHQLYIAFRGDTPISPIPPGYYLYNQQSGFIYPNIIGSQTAQAYNPVTAGGNTQLGVNQGGMIQGFDKGGLQPGEEGYHQHTDANGTIHPSPVEFGKIDSSNVFGNYSFQDPYDPTKTITQTSPEYMQTLANITAQKTINPASTIAQTGVQYMREVDAAGNELMPGTVIESTAGQALSTAPIVTGDQIAQVQGVTQARGADNFNPQALLEASGTQSSANPFIYDQTKNKYVAYGDGELAGTIISEMTPAQFASAFQLNLGDYAKVPGAAQMNLTQAAPAVKADLANLTATQQQAIARDAEGNPIRDAAGNVLFTSAPTQLISAQESSISSIKDNLSAATKTDATDVSPPVDRKIQMGDRPIIMADGKTVMTDAAGNIMYEPSELISGTGVDQTKVDTAFGTDQVTAASLTGELATLMKDFEGGDTPIWAAGAMRQATAVMNQRGLGASSMAGQAIVQAAMEAALPIAQIEAGNKQQVALFNGEQRAKFLKLDFDQAFQAKVQNAARVSEVANLNFTAKQTIALENSRAANTVNLADLSNKQAVIMAEAAALSQLDVTSLNNRQQAAVQNAQNFLQVDMANLTNAQQTAMFKAQTQSQALLSDTAQANASAQFNATSENQTNQFFSNLSTQVSQFNAAQQNAIDQFNAEEANALLEFNSALQNQREMFNSQNYLAVAQANAVWRQGINTANTQAQNLSNAQYAKDVNGLSQKALDDFWQKERDLMAFTFAQSESANDRVTSLMLGDQTLQGIREKLQFEDAANQSAFLGHWLFGDWTLGKYLKEKITSE